MQKHFSAKDQLDGQAEQRNDQIKADVKNRAELEKQLEREQLDTRRQASNDVMLENQRLMMERRERLKRPAQRSHVAECWRLPLPAEAWSGPYPAPILTARHNSSRRQQKAQEMEQDLRNLEMFNERWGSTPR